MFSTGRQSSGNVRALTGACDPSMVRLMGTRLSTCFSDVVSLQACYRQVLEVSKASSKLIPLAEDIEIGFIDGTNIKE